MGGKLFGNSFWSSNYRYEAPLFVGQRTPLCIAMQLLKSTVGYIPYIHFDSLTCTFCKMIPNCDEFWMCLYRESRSNIKRHGIDTGKGRILDHLTQTELKIVARDVNSTHRLTMWSIWWERKKVATLSIRNRSLK